MNTLTRPTPARHLVANSVAAFMLAALCLAPLAQAQPLAKPERAPDVPYQPTNDEVVVAMLDLAKVKASDVVYDLGCGDGRIVIAAVKERGARGVCVDIDPQRIVITAGASAARSTPSTTLATNVKSRVWPPSP